jgi:diadenosine tetraphosphatase ApaH/serine/threonine PP2A family protein phosphatase
VFNDVFDHLPVVADVDESYFCVHGGLPTGIQSLEEIERACRKQKRPFRTEEGTILYEITWNDLDEVSGLGVSPISGSAHVQLT